MALLSMTVCDSCGRELVGPTHTESYEEYYEKLSKWLILRVHREKRQGVTDIFVLHFCPYCEKNTVLAELIEKYSERAATV